MMVARNRTERSQNAYKKRDQFLLKKIHSKKAIIRHLREKEKESGRYVGDFIYGALDGIVTTFAVVSGVQGAQLSYSALLILGFANLFADGLSMAIGNYLSTKSEIDYIKKEMEREEWEIKNYPEGEKEEIRQIYRKKGFKGKHLDMVVKIITSKKKTWVDSMIRDELGLYMEEKTPLKSAIVTFLSFIILGFVPLTLFVISMFTQIDIPDTFMLSIILTSIALFVVGSMKTMITDTHWLRSGLEMLVIGGFAASVAYAIGYLLQTIV